MVCVPKILSTLMRWQNRLSWWNDRAAMFRFGHFDAWKAYMRRAANTINYGRTLPLAQGVKFDVA